MTPPYAQALRQELRLEYEVLAYLQKGGPRNWDVLYVLFDQFHPSGLIGKALHKLKNLELIEEDQQLNVYCISLRGTLRLRDKGFWKAWGVAASDEQGHLPLRKVCTAMSE